MTPPNDNARAVEVLRELLRRFNETIPTPMNKRGESTMRIEHFVNLVHEARQAIDLFDALRQQAQPVDHNAAEALRAFAEAGGHGYRPESLREWADQIDAMQGSAVTAQPEARGGEVDYTGIANRAQAVTGRSVWPSTVKAVLEAAGLATPPQQRVEPVAWAFEQDDGWGEYEQRLAYSKSATESQGCRNVRPLYLAPPAVAEKMRGLLVLADRVESLCTEWGDSDEAGKRNDIAAELRALTAQVWGCRQAALSSHPQAEQPGEFVRVPRGPTIEQLVAGDIAAGRGNGRFVRPIYDAMIAAAQQQGEGENG